MDRIEKFIEENNLPSKSRQHKQELLDFFNKIDRLAISLQHFERKLEREGQVSEKRVQRILNQFFKSAEQFESAVGNQLLINKTKRMFRAAVRSYIFKSNFLKRGFIKPRGYPGDFKIIEAMYNNKPISPGIGYVLDKYFLSNDYVKAVQDRKNSMRVILKEYISSSENNTLNILNLACGSCREIRELVESGPMPKIKVKFILVDQDPQCLEFSEKQLRNYPTNISFKFIQADIIHFLRNPTAFVKKINKQDLIYSIGLADYLPSSILCLLFKQGFRLLSPKGRFIVAHKNTKVYSSPISDWGADWKFIPRDQEELENIVKISLDKEAYLLDLFFRKSNLIFYMCLRRRI